MHEGIYMIKLLAPILLFFINFIFSNILYVATTGSDQSGEGSLDNPFLTIQHGINESTTGDTVLILEGYYSENIDYEMSYTDNDILTLCSEFTITGDSSKISSTVISGQESGSILEFYWGGSVIIDGITIEGGYDEYQSQDGLWVESTGKFTFSNSILKNCQVYNGHGVGGQLNSIDSIFIYNSKILSNHDNFNTDGVILINNVDYVSINKVEFSDNSSVTGSAIRLEDANYLEIDSSRFNSNISNVGGIIWTGPSSISIKNSLFNGNSGLLSVLGYRDPEWHPFEFLIDIEQTSIINNDNAINYQNYNSPPQNGQQVPEFEISNTIFWDNEIDIMIPQEDFSGVFMGSLNVMHCLIDSTADWNNYNSGINNIFLDPQFCDEENGDYTLADSSPLVSGGVDGTQIGYHGIGCSTPSVVVNDDFFEMYGSTGLFDILENDLVVYEIIDSIEIVQDVGALNIYADDSLFIVCEASEGFYGTESFTYVIHYAGLEISGNVQIQVYIESVVDSFLTQGSIYGGLAMLDETSLYAVSSNDAVYRLNSDLMEYYSLDVGGDINSASTITSDHKVYIGSSDNNLYSFNSSGVSNPNWPRPMGSELTASVTIDSDGNLYLGTDNGIFQAVTEDNESIWSYNCGSPIYSSAAITEQNRLIICTYDGRIICFDLTTIDTQTPSFEWLLPTGSQITSSPALDNEGNIYITLMDGRLIKVIDEGTSPTIEWEISTEQGIEASPVIDGNGDIYFATTTGSIFKVSSEGSILWNEENEGYEIIGTPALDNTNLFVAFISSEEDTSSSDTMLNRNILTNLIGYDEEGIIFSKNIVSGRVESSLLVSEGEVFFGNTDGIVFKSSIEFQNSQRDSHLPMWGTFQGNNQRTGNQNNSELQIEENLLIPIAYKLHQNYPNPFNPLTKIRYELPENDLVSINIYDMMGRKIKSLVNSKQTSGYHTIYWDATNEKGEGVSAGMYIFTIQAGKFSSFKKMILLK